MKKILLLLFLLPLDLGPWTLDVQAALSTSLISYWPMNEASGNGVDLAGTNTLVDNATVTSNPGKVYATARQFTAANLEYFSVADNASISVGGTAFSYAVWVYIDTIVSGDTVILAKDVGSDGEYDLVLQGSGAGSKFYAQTWTGTSHAGNVIVAANNFGAPTAGTWNLVVFTSDQTTNKISVNAGTQNTAAAASAGWNSTSAFSIGRYGGGAYFGGRIGPVAFWKQALSTTDITTFYNNGAGLTYQGILGSGIIMHPLTSGSSSTLTSITTSSVTTQTNDLVLLTILSSGTTNAATGLSGLGLTWESVRAANWDTTGTPTKRIEIWRGQGSGTSGTIAFTVTGSDGIAYLVKAFSGVAVGGNGAFAIVQNNTSATTGGTSVSTTLSAFADAVNNVAYGVFGINGTGGIAPGVGFIELGDVTYTSPSAELQDEWRTGEDLSVDASFASSNAGAIALELTATLINPAIFEDDDEDQD